MYFLILPAIIQVVGIHFNLLKIMKKPSYWEEAKHYLSRKDPVLSAVMAQYEGETLVSSGDPFVTLIRSVTGQQISVKAAASIWQKLEICATAITPEIIHGIPVEILKQCGFSSQKIAYMKNIAYHFKEGALQGGVWEKQDISHIQKTLLAIKGIGPWTVDMFSIFYLLHPDVLPLSDIGLKKAIEKHYAEGATLTKEACGVIAAHWQPYRTVATWYLWRSLDPHPVAY